jgi:hypothetical protein
MGLFDPARVGYMMASLSSAHLLPSSLSFKILHAIRASETCRATAQPCHVLLHARARPSTDL